MGELVKQIQGFIIYISKNSHFPENLNLKKDIN